MLESYTNLLARWRYGIIILTLMIVAIAASGAQRLKFSSDYRVFFGEDNPQLMAFDDLQKTYTKNDNILILLAPDNQNIYTQEFLKALSELTEKSWQVPYSSRVDSITNYQHTEAEEDDLIVEDLVLDADELSQDDLKKIKQVTMNEPLLKNRLVSLKGNVAAVNINIELPENPDQEVQKIVKFVRDMTHEFGTKHPELKIYITGVLMMNNAFTESAIKDMKSLIPLMFLIVILVLSFLLRSFYGTFSTLLVIILSIVTAMGIAGWLNILLTPPAMSSITVIMTLAVADSVHVLITFFHQINDGHEKFNAMKESIRINMQPIFLTSLTTAIGFLTMNFSDVPPFRDLGNIVSLGVLGAFVFSIFSLPAIMMIFPVKTSPEQNQTNIYMENLGQFVVNNHNKLLIIMSMVVIILVMFLPQNELNDQYVKYFDKSIKFRTDSDFADKNLNGLYYAQYSIPSHEAGGINNFEYLTNLEKLSNWLSKQPEVTHVNTITDMMKRLNKNLHADDESWYKLPEERVMAAQYLLLYEMSLPFGLDLTNQINLDKSSSLLTATLRNLKTQEMIDFEKRVQSWMDQNTPSLKAQGTGTTMMFANIGIRNIKSMLSATTIALFCISFILIFALRSVKIGLISMIPNLVPAGMAFGLWGIISGEIGLALSVVVGMTLGIVVDDTVHFLSKYLRARRELNLNSEEAVKYAFSTVGTALLVTSIVLIAGFCILSLSSFKLNSEMGIVTAITISFALIADFLLLPPILMKLKGKI
jgi:uncharacterized protein